ncbi:MAG: ribosome small subunit-dependent GTPase A [Magnetococcales bacterium]|nr:ribosome small subunit-dependent GTPase A [Magnetococcales bacterium]
MPRKREGQALTLRQLERVRTARTKRVAEPGDLGPEENGSVVAHFGLNVEVMPENGACVRCAVRETLEVEPVCGDRVVWRQAGEHNQGVIVAVLPRRSQLQRPGPHRRLLTVAANVDRIVVVGASGTLNPGLLDRYLAAARKAEIEAMLVINKADLATDPRGEAEVLAPYERMGYPVLRASAIRREGLEALEGALTNLASIFVGESGVGKSSLIGLWIPEGMVRTAEVHPGTGQGRHATTTARMYPLPRGGAIIDSPGVREFGLHGVERESLPMLFRDMAPLLGACRFSDCRHQLEPGCALRAAAASGEVSPARLTSMLRIMESLPSRNPFFSPEARSPR